MLTHSGCFLRLFAGVVCFALHCYVFELCSIAAAAVPEVPKDNRITDNVMDLNVLMVVFDEECNADKVKERALRNSVRQAPPHLRAGDPRQERATLIMTEALPISARQVASYEAYTRTLVVLTFPEFGSSDIAEERFFVSCTVNDEMLHKVGVNILNFHDCPLLERAGLKGAFEEEPCVNSVEFSQEVQITGGLRQEADNRRSALAVHRLPDSTARYVPYNLQRTLIPLPSPTTSHFASERLHMTADSYSVSFKHHIDYFLYLWHAKNSTARSHFPDPVEPVDPASPRFLGYTEDYPSGSPPLTYKKFPERWQHSDFPRTVSPTAVSACCGAEAFQYWREIAGFNNLTNSVCDASVVVALVDTGIALNHPCLRNNVWVNAGEIPGNNLDDDGNGFIDDVNGYNFMEDSGNVDDDNGHGTHCAGIIGGKKDEFTETQGVCESVSIAALKFLDAFGRGSSADAVRALNYALQMKFPISSHSWGVPEYSPALGSAVSKAGEAGHLVIAAAGNSGTNLDDRPFYPAALRLSNVIAVAATDTRDNIASFSNTGVDTVHVAAPGVNVLSTFPPDTFRVLSGTSAAAPVVTGLAALLWSVFQGNTSAMVKEAILQGVDKLPTARGRLISAGRINAAKSIQWLWRYGGGSIKQQKKNGGEVVVTILALG